MSYIDATGTKFLSYSTLSEQWLPECASLVSIGWHKITLVVMDTATVAINTQSRAHLMTGSLALVVYVIPGFTYVTYITDMSILTNDGNVDF